MEGRRMTATVTPIRPSTNGRRPIVLEVPQAELVGNLCDWQALAEEAVDANGAALQTTLRLPAGPWRDELQAAHIYAHDRLKALLTELRFAAGIYDKPNRGA